MREGPAGEGADEQGIEEDESSQRQNSAENIVLEVPREENISSNKVEEEEEIKERRRQSNSISSNCSSNHIHRDSNSNNNIEELQEEEQEDEINAANQQYLQDMQLSRAVLLQRTIHEEKDNSMEVECSNDSHENSQDIDGFNLGENQLEEVEQIRQKQHKSGMFLEIETHNQTKEIEEVKGEQLKNDSLCLIRKKRSKEDQLQEGSCSSCSSPKNIIKKVDKLKKKKKIKGKQQEIRLTKKKHSKTPVKTSVTAVDPYNGADSSKLICNQHNDADGQIPQSHLQDVPSSKSDYSSSYRSDAPDYFLSLIDETINSDWLQVLRKELCHYTVDHMVKSGCSSNGKGTEKNSKIVNNTNSSSKQRDNNSKDKQTISKGTTNNSSSSNNKFKSLTKVYRYLPFNTNNFYTKKDIVIGKSTKTNKKNIGQKGNKDQIQQTKQNQEEDEVDEEEADTSRPKAYHHGIIIQLPLGVIKNQNEQKISIQGENDVNSSVMMIKTPGLSFQQQIDQPQLQLKQMPSSLFEEKSAGSNSQASTKTESHKLLQHLSTSSHHRKVIKKQSSSREISDSSNSSTDIFQKYSKLYTKCMEGVQTTPQQVTQAQSTDLPDNNKNVSHSNYEDFLAFDRAFIIPANNFLELQKQQKLKNIPEKQLHCLMHTSLRNIDAIRTKAVSNSYYTIWELENDMRKLFNYTLHFRCKSLHAYQYITSVIKAYQAKMTKMSSIGQLEKVKRQDLTNLLSSDIENKMAVKKWPIIPESYRNYEQISEYEFQPASAKESLQEKLRSLKKPTLCRIDCECHNYDTLGEFDLESSTWRSKCPNREKRMECLDACNCRNSAISQKKRKIIDQDVQETLCWGIDLYTKKNIFYLLPESFSDEEKNRFIQYPLMKAINLQREKGWDLMHSCEFILTNSESKLERIKRNEEEEMKKKEKKNKNQSINDSVGTPSSANHSSGEGSNEFMFTSLERKCAKSIIKAMLYVKKNFIETSQDSESLFAEAFRVHTKGMGLICINRKGIQKNELITEYIGQIYEPWRWYEKQDILKKHQKKTNQRDFLPDFWNIMLEMHKDDPKGYDILFVDPILKGNYSSRLSHSCEPNCGTVPTVANTGNYVIGMFAMHPIEYGEELQEIYPMFKSIAISYSQGGGISIDSQLSFDYMAVTESVLEHKRAVCLCGATRCRGKYLELSTSNIKQFNSILERIHSSIKRTHLLVQACQETHGENEESVGFLSVMQQVQYEQQKQLQYITLSQADQQILDSYSIRSSVLFSLPVWLQRWTASILRVIQQEFELFYSELLHKKISSANKDNSITGISPSPPPPPVQQLTEEEHAILKHQAHSRKEARIQNLVISLSKVNYYISMIKDRSPPLEILSKAEILARQWSNASSNSKTSSSDQQQLNLREIIVEVINSIDNLPAAAQDAGIDDFTANHFASMKNQFQVIDHAVNQLLLLISNHQQSDMNPQANRGLLIIRLFQLTISDILQRIVSHHEEKYQKMQEQSNDSSHSPQCVSPLLLHYWQYHSMLLYMNSFTRTSFTTHSYAKHIGEAQKIERQDVMNVEIFDCQDKESNEVFAPFEESKAYSSLFVWGQLNMWYKQTVTSPQTTLSLERRGTLIQPYFSTVVVAGDTKTSNSMNAIAQNQLLREFFKTKPDVYWTADCECFRKCSFKNPLNIFGSFLLDGELLRDEISMYVRQVADNYAETLGKKLQFFMDIEENKKCNKDEEVETANAMSEIDDMRIAVCYVLSGDFLESVKDQLPDTILQEIQRIQMQLTEIQNNQSKYIYEMSKQKKKQKNNNADHIQPGNPNIIYQDDGKIHFKSSYELNPGNTVATTTTTAMFPSSNHTLNDVLPGRTLNASYPTQYQTPHPILKYPLPNESDDQVLLIKKRKLNNQDTNIARPNDDGYHNNNNHTNLQQISQQKRLVDSFNIQQSQVVPSTAEVNQQCSLQLPVEKQQHQHRREILQEQASKLFPRDTKALQYPHDDEEGEGVEEQLEEQRQNLQRENYYQQYMHLQQQQQKANTKQPFNYNSTATKTVSSDHNLQKQHAETIRQRMLPCEIPQMQLAQNRNQVQTHAALGGIASYQCSSLQPSPAGAVSQQQQQQQQQQQVTKSASFWHQQLEHIQQQKLPSQPSCSSTASFLNQFNLPNNNTTYPVLKLSNEEKQALGQLAQPQQIIAPQNELLKFLYPQPSPTVLAANNQPSQLQQQQQLYQQQQQQQQSQQQHHQPQQQPSIAGILQSLKSIDGNLLQQILPFLESEQSSKDLSAWLQLKIIEVSSQLLTLMQNQSNNHNNNNIQQFSQSLPNMPMQPLDFNASSTITNNNNNNNNAISMGYSNNPMMQFHSTALTDQWQSLLSKNIINSKSQINPSDQLTSTRNHLPSSQLTPYTAPPPPQQQSSLPFSSLQFSQQPPHPPPHQQNYFQNPNLQYPPPLQQQQQQQPQGCNSTTITESTFQGKHQKAQQLPSYPSNDQFILPNSSNNNNNLTNQQAFSSLPSGLQHSQTILNSLTLPAQQQDEKKRILSIIKEISKAQTHQQHKTQEKKNKHNNHNKLHKSQAASQSNTKAQFGNPCQMNEDMNQQLQQGEEEEEEEQQKSQQNYDTQQEVVVAQAVAGEVSSENNKNILLTQEQQGQQQQYQIPLENMHLIESQERNNNNNNSISAALLADSHTNLPPPPHSHSPSPPLPLPMIDTNNTHNDQA